MATEKKIAELIAAIKTIYPYYANETDVETLVNTWNLLLKDYSDNLVDLALLECLKICKTPPTPADVIEQLNILQQAQQIPVGKIWDTLIDALHKADNLISRFNYSFVEDNGLTQGQNAKNDCKQLWKQLPEEIKNYIGCYGEFIRMSRNYTDNDLKFEKNKFIKAIPAIRKEMIKALNHHTETKAITE
jgi:hypothetical protein